MPIISALIVSIDAFFIGLSFGLQKTCKFIYLAIINAFLFVLCILGFLIAERIYESIPFEPDYIVGFSFILLGMWTIFSYFILEHIKQRKIASSSVEKTPIKSFVLIGVVMSVEAMFITMGLTFIFLPNLTWLIPITVALAHFVYSTLSFYLARTKYVRRIPAMLSHIISGISLIIYGLLALFVEISV